MSDFDDLTDEEVIKECARRMVKYLAFAAMFAVRANPEFDRAMFLKMAAEHWDRELAEYESSEAVIQ